MGGKMSRYKAGYYDQSIWVFGEAYKTFDTEKEAKEYLIQLMKDYPPRKNSVLYIEKVEQRFNVNLTKGIPLNIKEFNQHRILKGSKNG